VCLKYCLSLGQRSVLERGAGPKKKTYASTLEKSCDGDMTKLSALCDHEMRCCMLGSSSMLPHSVSRRRPLPGDSGSPRPPALTCTACV